VTYGYIWVLDETRTLEDPAVLRAVALAEHAAVYLARQSRERRSEAVMLDELLSADRESSSSAAGSLLDSGFLPRGNAVVSVVVGLWRADAPAELAINLWHLSSPVLRSSESNQTTLLVPLRRGDDLGPARDIAAQVLALYAQRLTPKWRPALVAGIGGPRTDLLDARASWQEARIAARVATAVPDTGPIAEWESLGAYRLLAADARVDLAALIFDDATRRLIEHPDVELRHTLQVYFEHAGNAQKTAEALHVHRQTLYYRIAKAEQVTGIDLRTGHGRLRLQLALTMAPLLNR
jgi:sugar diacid utilization regulator